MRTYILAGLFLLGFIWKIIERIKFEKNKIDCDEKYITLFRGNNILLIVLFLGLFLYNVEKLING